MVSNIEALSIQKKGNAVAKNQITTVDIGTNSVKVLQLDLAQTGIVIVNSGVESYPRLSATEKVSDETVIEALSQLILRKGFRMSPVAMAVPRQFVTVKALAGLPTSATDEDIDKMVPIQVEPELPFAIADAIYCGYNLQRPREGVSLEVVAAKRASIDRYVNIAEKVGLKLKAIIPSTFATYGTVFDQFKELLTGRTVAVADIGAGMTDICIVQHGRLAFSRSFVFGGNNLTQAFEKNDTLTFQEAEAQKIGDAGLRPTAEDAMSRDWADNLHTQIAQSFRAFTGEDAKRIDGLWLCGGGSSVRGLDNYLADKLGVETILWNPLERIEDQSIEAEPQRNLSVALGLGIIGAAGEKRTPTVNANLLPKEIGEREERTRRKILGALAAAMAVIILIGGGLGFGGWRRSQAAFRKSAAGDLKKLEMKEETINARRALENSFLMQQMLTPYVTPLEVLRKMSDMFPDREKVALTNFNMDKKGKVSMSVAAASHGDVSGMIQALSEAKLAGKAKLFDEVKHGTISRVTKDRRPILQVQITCVLNQDAMQEID